MSNYPTNLTEKQWQVIKNIVEPQERNRKSSLREILNGIFYVNKSGCQWRMLPSDFTPWQTVYGAPDKPCGEGVRMLTQNCC